MGTHISKGASSEQSGRKANQIVKSIDLDIWQPEQMEVSYIALSLRSKADDQNIQKWGNRRANLYWEKHLKAGHVPPDQ
jgi:stromal membrane-associated protein